MNTNARVLTQKLFGNGRLHASQETAREAWGVSENTYYNYARIVIGAGYATYLGKKTRGSSRDLVITAAGKEVIGSTAKSVTPPAPADNSGKPPADSPVVTETLSISPELLDAFSNALSTVAAFNAKSSGPQLGIVIARKEGTA